MTVGCTIVCVSSCRVVFRWYSILWASARQMEIFLFRELCCIYSIVARNRTRSVQWLSHGTTASKKRFPREEDLGPDDSSAPHSVIGIGFQQDTP